MIGPLHPNDRRQAEAWLSARRIDWPAGRTLVARQAGGIAALARLADPSPGDGHHVEHVRLLELAGEPAAMAELACAAVADAGPRVRVEAWCSEGRDDVVMALTAGGLDLEVRLPDGWSIDHRRSDWLGFGRPGEPLPRAASAGAEPAPPAPRADAAHAPTDRVTFRWADAATRPALARFLAALVPGRAYPAGTLLSQAEELETQRRGALLAPWLLALDPRGEVAGGLVLERVGPRERAHVRRLHLDVLRAWRGRGIATELVRRALDEAWRLGVARLEADPRSGHAVVRRALERGGLRVAGVQRRAWRLRRAGSAWDEDVVVYSGAGTR